MIKTRMVIKIVELKDRVAIISEENFSRLSSLYGELDIEDLQRIVNKHITVAIDEIEEDIAIAKRFKTYNDKFPYGSEKDFEEN